MYYMYMYAVHVVIFTILWLCVHVVILCNIIKWLCIIIHFEAIQIHIHAHVVGHTSIRYQCDMVVHVHVCICIVFL